MNPFWEVWPRKLLQKNRNCHTTRFVMSSVSLHSYHPVNHDLSYLFIQSVPIVFLLFVSWQWSWILGLGLLVLHLASGYYVYLSFRPQRVHGGGKDRGEHNYMENKGVRLSVFDKVEKAEVNPFVSYAKAIDQEERVRMACVAAVLLPARLIGIFLTLVVIAAVAKIATYGYVFDKKNPKPISPEKLIYFTPVLKGGARLILFFLGYLYIPIFGKRASANEARIVISNHLTFVEPLLLVALYAPMPVAAREYVEMPIIGTIIQALQLIPIDRQDPDSRVNVQKAIVERASNPEWGQVLIFPEATCTNGLSIIQFKVGAFAAGKPVQPNVVRFFPGEGGRSHFNPCWVSAGPQLGEIVIRLLCEPVNWVALEHLPAYIPNQDEQKDAKLFAHNVRALMGAKLNLKLTRHSFDDVILQNEAVKGKMMPPEMAVLEVDKITESLHIKLDDCKKMLHTFHEMDVAGTGRISYGQFARGLGYAEDNAFVENLCHLIDNDEKGSIDFRSYVLGLGILNSETDADLEAAVKLAFRMFDVKGSGKIPVATLREMFHSHIANVTQTEEDEAFAPFARFDEIDFDAFKAFALKDPRYVTIFKKSLTGVRTGKIQ